MTLSRRNFLKQSAAVMSVAASWNLTEAFARDSSVVRASELGIELSRLPDATEGLASILNSGRVFDGEGQTLSVARNVVAGNAFKGLRNVTLKGAGPQSGRRWVLMVDGAEGFALDNVIIVRGGDGGDNPDKSYIHHTGGALLNRCRDFRLGNLDVSGGGIGTGLCTRDCSDFSIQESHAHDIWYKLSEHPNDDAIQGILVLRCRDFALVKVGVSDIGGTGGRTRTYNNNRGIAIAGCKNFVARDLTVRRVGQGFDVTGGGGNSEFLVSGGTVEDCFSWGFKFANTAQNGRILNSVARRCGIGGFVVSGPSEQGTAKTQSILVEHCLAEEVLGNHPTFSASFGFGILSTRIDPTFPRDTLFRHCRAVTTGANRMMYGYRNDVPERLAAGQPNRVIDCKAEGYSAAAFHGF